MSPEVKARLAQAHAVLEGNGSAGETPDEAAPALAPGQTALFNAFDDAVECAKCGGRMVRTGSCYVPRLRPDHRVQLVNLVARCSGA